MGKELDIEDEKFEALLSEKRHKELTGSLRAIAIHLSNKDDKEIVDAIKEQPRVFKEAIEEVIKSIPEPKEPQVNVSFDYDNLVTLFKEISKETVDKIEASNNKVIEALDSRMLPDSFELVKTFGGVTQSVKVKYKSAKEINNNKK